jgi:hypothetical protein
MAGIVLMFAQGLSDAQLKVGDCSSVDAAILKASPDDQEAGVGDERVGLEAL